LETSNPAFSIPPTASAAFSLNEKYRFLNLEQYKYIQQLEKQGKYQEAAKVLQVCNVTPDDSDVQPGGVKVVSGRLIESMHILEAQRCVRMYKAIEKMSASRQAERRTLA
jgi:phage-related minor tail protein